MFKKIIVDKTFFLEMKKKTYLVSAGRDEKICLEKCKRIKHPDNQPNEYFPPYCQKPFLFLEEGPDQWTYQKDCFYHCERFMCEIDSYINRYNNEEPVIDRNRDDCYNHCIGTNTPTPGSVCCYEGAPPSDSSYCKCERYCKKTCFESSYGVWLNENY